MNSDTPLYNSRITKTYIEYVGRTYPDVNLDNILAYAGITEDEIKDQAHWFSQKQVDRFQEALVRETQNPNIAREAGRFSVESESVGVAKHYILGLLNPYSFYLLMSKVYSVFSRGVAITAKKAGMNRVEIVAKPYPGVDEKPYQCLNRMGTFESAAKFFLPTYANIEHPECYHKGDDACRYIVTWEKSRYPLWNTLKNYSYLVGIMISLMCFIFLTKTQWLIATLFCALLSVFLLFMSKNIQYEDIKNTAETQGNLAKDLLDEMAFRNNNAVLIQEIGQVTSSILDIDELIRSVVKSMETHMDFDRGLVMLANEDKTRLVFKAGFGYITEKEDLLQKTEFNLTNPNSQGAFVLAYKNQKPFLINNVSEIENRLSPKSLQFAREMGAESVICVPIFYKQESLGILTVDNIKSKRPLAKSDLNMLMGVASQMAISITNALSYKKLKESEEKYRDLVENANSIIMRLDINGNVTFFNEFAQKFFMYTESEIIGKSYEKMFLTDQIDIKNDFRWLVSTFRKDPDKPVISEGETILKNGKKVWVTWTNKPIFDEPGNIKEILSIGNDITELKKAEIEKKHLEARLQRAEKMEAIGTLAGGVAHDLNNILSGIVSYPELLLLDLPSDSKLIKPVTTIQKAGERASAIVQDLLTLARRGVVTRNVINLNDIVLDYLKSPEYENLKHHHPNVTVHTDLQPTLLNILGSGIHLNKTLMNLIINAAEAIGDCGEITITTQNRHIDQNLNAYEQIKQGDYAILSVTDTGTGISEQELNRIFEPFYTKKIMGKSGTGLGMAVVWGTIKDHNAYIDVKTAKGEGTTFTLFFPVTKQIGKPADSNTSFQNYKGKGEKILIVDDIKEQREIASNMLFKLGYSPVAVPTGEDAVEYVRTHSVDLIVLDMILGNGMDGLDTYKKILETTPNQKAIITSGFSETERVKETQKLGATHYLRKPYILEQLGKTIKNELSS